MLTSLEDTKAEDIVSIDLRGKTTLADLMIIATGRSNVHVRAIADRVIKACKAAGYPAPRIEGLPHCDWVLLDAQRRHRPYFQAGRSPVLQSRKDVGRGSPARDCSSRRSEPASGVAGPVAKPSGRVVDAARR